MDADEDTELFRLSGLFGLSFVFTFGGRPRPLGLTVGGGFVWEDSPSLSELLDGENKFFIFDLSSLTEFRLSVQFRVLLAVVVDAADLHICWCCLTMAGGALPPVDGNGCGGGCFAFTDCDANGFFLISF